MGRCTLLNVNCRMQKFEQVYYAEFHMRNIPQITSSFFFVFRKIQITSNN